MSLHCLKAKETQLSFGNQLNHYHIILLHPYPVKLSKVPLSQLQRVYVMHSMHITFLQVIHLKRPDLLPLALIMVHLAGQTNLTDLFIEAFYRS